MLSTDFSANAPDTLIQDLGGHVAFLPAALPPQLNPPTWDFLQLVVEAERALSELKGVTTTLPNPYLLIRAFQRREATLSSQIEGTQSGLRDLVLFEIEETAPLGSDVKEIANYVRAMQHGMEQLKEIPFCLNLLREMHAILLSNVRGQDKSPGKFRREPVWIGARNPENARYVPPPWEHVEDCLRDLENYIHADSELPYLVRLALIHYQFEAIHPFCDGNGRIGRLMLPLLLCHRGILDQPLIYVSAYFEKYKDIYFDMLLEISKTGNWQQWIEFFLKGVRDESLDGVRRAHRLQKLQEVHRERLNEIKASVSVRRAAELLFDSPAISLRYLEKEGQMAYSAAQNAVQKLQQIQILEEITGRQRNQIFIAPEIIDILESPTA